jgi:hydroxymethylbilane synthase
VKSSPPLRLGTRGSLLATTQSGWVAERLTANTGRDVELVPIRTRGDRVTDRPLAEIGGMGLFTREVDLALLDDEVDVAVHSLKDLPTRLIDGVTLGAVPERADPRDVLITPSSNPSDLGSLKEGARVGTGSLRRRALLLALRPDLDVRGIRGNLDTRIQSVERGDFDAIVLAAAGLERLGWTDRIHHHMDPGGWLPAPAQGALAVVVREGDEETLSLVRTLDHPPSRAGVTAERSVMHHLEAGCQLPVGALGLPYGGGMRLRALVASPDGRRLVRTDRTGAQDDPEALGRAVAEQLLELGADEILQTVRDEILSRPGR